MAHKRFGNIEVKPIVSSAAYVQYDVLWNPIKIPGAVQGLRGASLLKSICIIDIDDDLVDTTMELVFMKVAKDLGSVNEDSNRAASTYMVKKDGTASESCVILGHVEIVAGDSADSNTMTAVSLITKTGIDLVIDAGGMSDDDNDEGAIFCGAVLTSDSTPDFTATTDLRIRFGFEY